MTAHDLARKLLAGPNLPVCRSHPSGDYWRTVLASSIEDVEVSRVIESRYHGTGKVVDEEDSDFEEAKEVILLG